MANWQDILQLQLRENPPRLTVEEATILYNEADQNELLHAGLLLRRKRVPGNKVTYLVDRNVNYTMSVQLIANSVHFIAHQGMKKHTLNP